MDIKKLVKETDILPAAGIPYVSAHYAGKHREFEFLGYASLLNGTPLTTYTLRHLGEDNATIGDIVGFLNLYSQEKPNNIILMPFQAAVGVQTTARQCPEISNQIRGTKLITNMAVLRGDKRTKLGFRPLIENGKIIKFLDGEAVAEEDLSGSVAYLDENYWTASEKRSTRQKYTAGRTYFHSPLVGGVRLEKSLVGVEFEDDSLHVFSNIGLDEEDTTVRFPMVRMRTLKF